LGGGRGRGWLRALEGGFVDGRGGGGVERALEGEEWQREQRKLPAVRGSREPMPSEAESLSAHPSDTPTHAATKTGTTAGGTWRRRRTLMIGRGRGRAGAEAAAGGAWRPSGGGSRPCQDPRCRLLLRASGHGSGLWLALSRPWGPLSVFTAASAYLLPPLTWPD